MDQAGNVVMVIIAVIVALPGFAIALWGVSECVTKSVTGLIEELTGENAPQRA